MIYRTYNYETGKLEYFDTREAAEQKAAEIATYFMQREEYRFSISKVTLNGNDTTWGAADLDIDPEEGDYKVFVHTTGAYEDFSSLSAAKVRMQQLKDEFFAGIVNIVEELEQMPVLAQLNVTPISTETM